jgi:cytochrome P450
MDTLPKDGMTINLLPLLKRLVSACDPFQLRMFELKLQTLDLSTEFIFGKSMDAQSSPESCASFIRAFTATQKGVVMPPSARDREWQAACKLVHCYVDERVNEAIARVSLATYQMDPGSPSMSTIDEMVKTTKDRLALRYQVLSVFSPAHDTAAVTLSNLFFHLARHPRV